MHNILYYIAVTSRSPPAAASLGSNTAKNWPAKTSEHNSNPMKTQYHMNLAVTSSSSRPTMKKKGSVNRREEMMM